MAPKFGLSQVPKVVPSSQPTTVDQNNNDDELELPLAIVGRNMVGSPRTVKVQV